MRRTATAILSLALLAPWTAAAAEAGAAPAGALVLSVEDAVLLALAGNRSLAVERLGPEIARTGVGSAAAAFDTALEGRIAYSRDRSPATTDGGYEDSDDRRLSLGASRLFSPGTTVGIDLGAADPDGSSSSARAGLSVTQALLRGGGRDVNLAAVRQARIDVALSEHELRGVAEGLVAEVEKACWDYLLAASRVGIVERSLRLAEEQLAEVRERIAVGRVAEIEQAAAEAEAALRREALINARSALATSRLRLLRLVNPPGANPLGREVTVTDLPALPPEDPDAVEAHVALADRMRPELLQARLQIERGDIEVVRTRNGLLPKLDLFLGIGKSGYASSLADSLDLGGEAFDAQAGLSLQFPLGNHAARASARRAVLSRGQARESLANLAQLVEVDVRGAWIEVARLREQAAATRVALRLQQEKLRAETEKFRVGKSTAFLVAQAQRDLLQAENDAESAVAGCLKALVELYRLEGSLLARRGIAVAGPTPATPRP